ncbi:MAG TPA: DUF4129 domain-containing protein, partial [Nitrososphaerales archaeon]|nr:DUF4129 domain-containing protein [Nitrososphaerales archaeon]
PDAGPARRRIFLSLAAAIVLAACVGALAVPPAHAADDSNAGQLTQAPTVSPAQLGTTLGTLAQGANDTQLQQLLSQFQSQLGSGNETGASSTLGQLQGISSSQNGTGSSSLNALLNSLSVGNNGASVNSSLLASLLTSGSKSESSQKLSVDMKSLAGLMQYVNPTLASELLQNSSLLSQSPFLGGNGAPVGGAPVSAPGLSGLPGISLPSAGAPSLSVGAPSGRVPSIPLFAFVIPLVVAGSAAALFFSRGRVVRLVGSQSLPGMAVARGARADDEREAGVIPSDPRRRIEFYFGRAVRLMGRRGVPKHESETHREFSAKCEGTLERPHVRTISSLYEKAKFSGQEVGSPEADLAASEFFAMGKEER